MWGGPASPLRSRRGDDSRLQAGPGHARIPFMPARRRIRIKTLRQRVVSASILIETVCRPALFFAPAEGRKVVAAFDGGSLRDAYKQSFYSETTGGLDRTQSARLSHSDLCAGRGLIVGIEPTEHRFLRGVRRKLELGQSRPGSQGHRNFRGLYWLDIGRFGKRRRTCCRFR